MTNACIEQKKKSVARSYFEGG